MRVGVETRGRVEPTSPLLRKNNVNQCGFEDGGFSRGVGSGENDIFLHGKVVFHGICLRFLGVGQDEGVHLAAENRAVSFLFSVLVLFLALVLALLIGLPFFILTPLNTPLNEFRKSHIPRGQSRIHAAQIVQITLKT